MQSDKELRIVVLVIWKENIDNGGLWYVSKFSKRTENRFNKR